MVVPAFPGKGAPVRKAQSYRRLLRDPRWQRKRLEVLSRDGWRCRECGAKDRELQVHHERYVPGGMPWDVPSAWLVTLCTPCHRTKRKR